MQRFFLALWALAIPALVSAKPFSTPLLPEVVEILTLPTIDESSMTDNAYVALMGINAPEGEDYVEIGKKTILKNLEKVTKALAAQDLEQIGRVASPNDFYPDKESIRIIYILNDGERYYPSHCYNASNQYCLTKTIADQPKISQLINANQLLLERHKQIIKLPNYDSYFSSSSLPLLRFDYAVQLFNLHLAEAIFAVEQEDVEAGLAILEQEITYSKRILSSRVGLMDMMIAIRQLLIAYQVVEQLLDRPQFADQLQNPRLLALLEPFTEQQQQSIARAIEFERDVSMQSIYMMQASYQAEPWIFNVYDINATLNLIYEHELTTIKRLRLVLPEASEYFIKHPLSEIKKAPKNQLWWAIVQQVSAGNFVGANILKYYLPTEREGGYRSLYRLYALNNYLALAKLKLSIKQAGLSKQQVADYLVKVKAVNLYNQQPIVWDIEQQQLTTDVFLLNDGMFENNVISINVPFAQ